MKTILLFTIIFISNFCFAQDGHMVDEIKIYANYSFIENLMVSLSSSGDSIYFQNEGQQLFKNQKQYRKRGQIVP